MEKLSGMMVFAAVVEEGGFSAAAQRLKLSKAAVSKQVARLEEDLGARLMNRTTRRLSLTDVGQAFYDRCRRILAEVDEAVLAVGNMQTQPRGTLKINAPMTFGRRFIAPLTARMALDHPDLAIELELNDRYVDVVEEGYDLAVRIGLLPDSSLIMRRIAPVRRVVVGAPEYFRKHGMPKTLADLGRHHALTYTYQRGGESWPFQMPDGSVRAVPVQSRFRSNNGDAVKAATVAGLGLSLSPSFAVCDELRAGLLQVVELEVPPVTLALHAVFPHNRLLSAKVRVFIDMMVDAYGKAQPWELDIPRTAAGEDAPSGTPAGTPDTGG